jgi:hypothetical protein
VLIILATTPFLKIVVLPVSPIVAVHHLLLLHSYPSSFLGLEGCCDRLPAVS